MDKYELLNSINSPQDLRKISNSKLEQLCEEIRSFLVENVSKTGGHLGPNLGVVELTVALHKIFDTPCDKIVFDTGHQAYVHKILTGRKDFTTLRKKNGLSGYPSRAESPSFDIVENSHASTALAWADGISRGQILSDDYSNVIAVIGDGALTGGLAWEAINNISEYKDRRLIIVINDNGRSYAPTIGGLAKYFNHLRTNVKYESFKKDLKKSLSTVGKVGSFLYELLHGIKEGVKDIVTPNVIFENLGIKYVGPVDGHNISQLCEVFQRVSCLNKPVIVHVITQKGRGYSPAENDIHDCFHAVGKIHPETGLPIVPSRFGWTSVFADEVVKIGRENKNVVAITAAMLEPVGLKNFAAEFPDRIFDVGIAEGFGATFAAGLSFSGKHPIFALYSTFLNRAFDQVLFDVALHNESVTFVLDRAGVTGTDGASHNGMWDMALFSIVPGMHICVPRDENTLRAGLREAVDMNAVTLVRYPKGSLGADIVCVEKFKNIDVLYENCTVDFFVHKDHNVDFSANRQASLNVMSEQFVKRNLLIIGVGALVSESIKLAEKIASNYSDLNILVCDPHWVLPISSDLIDLSCASDFIVTLEDGLVSGGVGSCLREMLVKDNIFVPVKTYGIPDVFLQHATRDEIMESIGLTADKIFDDLKKVL